MGVGGFVLRQLAQAAARAVPATLPFLSTRLSRPNTRMSVQGVNYTPNSNVDVASVPCFSHPAKEDSHTQPDSLIINMQTLI